MNEYVSCAICGIKKGFALYDECRPEAAVWGIQLVGDLELKKHVWIVGKEQP